MSTSNTTLKVADIDFFSIRNNLKDYLRSQSEFTDYDFEGSGLSVLLDVLAYNTYYNSFYLNMAANEAFLDTAQIRRNILSHAKVINYVPTSARGALAKINITATPTETENQAINSVTLDQYTRLLGADVNGVSYPFVTINSNTSSKTSGSFNFANVMIKQGDVITLQFEMTANNSGRRFEIPSANVDTSTLKVIIQESSTTTTSREFTQAADISNLTANSYVYFVEENDNLNYSIYFGDDVIGYKPRVGNIIIVTYLDTLGAEANNISKFSFIEPIGGYFTGGVTVSTVSNSYGGTDKETIDQIRFRAPYYYSTQNRAVTVTDYETLVLKDYSNIESVSVWGGEDNDPIVYGKVFICPKTKGYYTLSNLEKESIKASLTRNRSVLTVIPEIVDPDYGFIQIRGRVTYNPRQTTKDTNQLLQTVKTAIENYNTVELNTFKSTFRKSKLQYYIESSDPSITGSDISIFVQKQTLLLLGQSRNYSIPFKMKLKKGGQVDEKLFSYPQVKIKDSSGIDRDIFFEEVPDSFTGIGTIQVTNAGTNYTSNTTVTIAGDGVGATARPTVIGGRIISIDVVTSGSNYSRATAVITGDGSFGAAKVVLNSQNGLIRAYYYKPNGEKIIVNPNAGTINYETGLIALTSLTPTSVTTNDFYLKDVLTISAVPDDDIITPLRNRILTIDQSINQTIQIEMVAES
jgi:hypothetical protein